MNKILVVEDEPGIALALEDSLRLEGHDVEVVTDGLVAAQRARDAAFDLILLDGMLPGKSGFDVCRDLRRAGLKNTRHFSYGKDAGRGPRARARPRRKRTTSSNRFRRLK